MTKTLDDYFRDWENDAMGFGYGTGEPHTIPAIRRFFETLKEDRRYDYREVEQEFGPLAGWLIINLLCKADILEYGTSPRFGWVTVKGERLRDYMLAKTVDQLTSTAMERNGPCGCFPLYCNCVDAEGPVCPNPFWRDSI